MTDETLAGGKSLDEARMEQIPLMPQILQDVIDSGGPLWSTQQLQADFEVEGFLAPYVVVRRKSDGVKGTLQFSHSPRYYFNFREDS